jgi:hypothetical protein
VRRRCPHRRVRCVHGDEINARRGRRRACQDCGSSLEGPLPEPCTVTGRPHLSAPDSPAGIGELSRELATCSTCWDDYDPHVPTRVWHHAQGACVPRHPARSRPREAAAVLVLAACAMLALWAGGVPSALLVLAAASVARRYPG